MMSMPTAKPDSLYADDLLHLNDAEPFPDHFEPGVFKPGDVMVSLRNINSIMVFDRETRRVRYMISGAFDGQHDPDFIDGNRFSVFDNNRISISATHQTSKISIVDARDNSIEVIYEGKEPNIFYTAFAGKHQWLPNGHLLISESCEGRAFELNPDMEIVWQYRKYVDDDIVTLLTQADRLDSKELSLRSQHVNPSKQSEP